MRFLHFKLSLFYLLLLGYTFSFSQNLDCNVQKHWFFGRGLTSGGGWTGDVIHMEFDCPNGNLLSVGPTPSIAGYGVEGTAVLNDSQSGQWILYSDGDNVVYSSASNVSGLGGQPSSSQSVAIAPINYCPIDSFLIFSNSTGGNNFGQISYIHGNTAGDIGPQVNLPLPTSAQIGGASNFVAGEGMLLISHETNLGDYWLITRLLKDDGLLATDAFVVYKLEAGMISIHQIFDINSNGDNFISTSILNNAYTIFNFNAALSELAVADGNPSASVFTLPFDPATGFLSGSMSNILSLSPLGAFDIEYSQNNQYLYYSDYGNGRISCLDFNNSSSTTIIESPFGPITRGLGLQTGPDGNLYALTYHTSNWSVFHTELWQIPTPNMPAPIGSPMSQFDEFLCAGLPDFITLHNYIPYALGGINILNQGDSTQIGILTDLSSFTGLSFSWFHNDQLISNANDSTIWVHSAGTYYVEIAFPSGCVYRSDDIIISGPNPEDIICGDIFVPSGFSPNADGENDILYAYSDCMQEMKFSIYNRWGQLIFETTDITAGWDGTFEGKELNAAVFAYILEGTLINTQEVLVKGNITLVR